MRKCRSHLQTTWGLRYFYSSLLHWNRIYLSVISFIGRILHSSHLRHAWYHLWFFEDAYHHMVWWVGRFVYLDYEKHQPERSRENLSSKPHLKEKSRRRESKLVYNPSWCVSSLELRCSPTWIHIYYLRFTQHYAVILFKIFYFF